MKLYFARDSIFCHSLSHFKELLTVNKISEITLYPAVKIKVKDTIYCKHFNVIGENHCGKQCHEYAPRNGKNGACKHLGSLYEPDYSKPLTIKL
jgi:hypothetical protein